MKAKRKKRVPRPRRRWVINPVTRVEKSEKKYSRRTAKKTVTKELDES
jgi:hypothetical protein